MGRSYFCPNKFIYVNWAVRVKSVFDLKTNINFGKKNISVGKIHFYIPVAWPWLNVTIMIKDDKKWQLPKVLYNLI